MEFYLIKKTYGYKIQRLFLNLNFVYLYFHDQLIDAKLVRLTKKVQILNLKLIFENCQHFTFIEILKQLAG